MYMYVLVPHFTNNFMYFYRLQELKLFIVLNHKLSCSIQLFNQGPYNKSDLSKNFGY